LISDFSIDGTKSKIDESLTDLVWPSSYQQRPAIDLISQCSSFKNNWIQLFNILKDNEENLNSLLVNQYGLLPEIVPEVSYTDITILQDELFEVARLNGKILFDECIIVQQFVSYGVGCILGRYSVENDGLILADAGATLEDFKVKVPDAQYLPDVDAILPLTDEDDFTDDLPTAFKSWLRYISGEHYDENLRWIEDRLGKDLRSFFDRDFYKDHIRRYKSRPIYWMVSSPNGAFRALIYLHRYSKDMVGKILNDYVRPYRTKIDQKIRGLESIMDSTGSSAAEKTKAKKRLAQLEKSKTEIEAWEKDSLYPMALKRIELDLDDGVKVNYRKLEGILEPVKQLKGKEEE
jgi:hypothetical protein